MKPIKCCKQDMELKEVVGRLSDWEMFFQCKKCGEIVMERRPQFYYLKLNNALQKDGE